MRGPLRARWPAHPGADARPRATDAYVMRPGTLPPSYNRFIVHTGPIRKEVLLAVRNNCRGLPVDVEAMAAHCRARGAEAVAPLPSPFPSAVSCSVLHPQRESCLRHNADVFHRVFRRILPLYLSLTFVPMLALRYRTVAARCEREGGRAPPPLPLPSPTPRS